MTAPIGPRDLPRIVIGVLFIALLGFGSLFVLKPFLPALVWATMIVVATWPLLKSVQRAAGGRRWIAVIVMMIALLVILIAPLAAALWTLASQAEKLVALKDVHLSIPPPPAWVASIPMAGEAIADEWQKIAGAGPEALAARFAPYMAEIGKWLAAQLGGLGGILLLLGLTVILCAVLYSTGDSVLPGSPFGSSTRPSNRRPSVVSTVTLPIQRAGYARSTSSSSSIATRSRKATTAGSR